MLICTLMHGYVDVTMLRVLVPYVTMLSVFVLYVIMLSVFILIVIAPLAKMYFPEGLV
jgi:hypothetical protein